VTIAEDCFIIGGGSRDQWIVRLVAALPLVVLASKLEDRPTPVPPAIAADELDGCRRGDRRALEAVFRAHAEPLARLLARIVGPSVEVEDLLQDTFASAITAFPTFRGEASVKTWLSRIAINVAYEHLRRPRHRREIVTADTESVREPFVHTTPELRETARRLYAHLDALDADKRIAIVLYAIEEHTVDEIAALVGASKTATRSRILWARRKLMKRMRKDPFFAGVELDRSGGKP
jgi:RNA polymerase sigma-70 factor (ECF subfamily)